MRAILGISVAALALSACTSTTNSMTDTTGANVGSETMTMSNGTDMAGNSAMGTGATAAMDAPGFVMTAAMSDRYEIESSRIALKKATSPEVKRFAQQMIDAHTKTTAMLKAAASSDGVAITPPGQFDAKFQTKIDALNSADAAGFDNVYVMQQRQAHTETLAMMQGYASGGDKPAIRKFAADTAPKVQMHLKMLGKMN